jgi:hypothetical protein
MEMQPVISAAAAVVMTANYNNTREVMGAVILQV